MHKKGLTGKSGDDPAALFIRASLRVVPAAEVPSDHHGIVIPVPANAEKGFMVLESGL